MSNKSIIDEAIDQMEQKMADSRGNRTGDYRIGLYAAINILENLRAMHVQEHGNTWDASMRNLQERGMNEVRAWEDFDEYYKETYK